MEGQDGSLPEVVVALDFADAARALSVAEGLPSGTWVKVGLELFTRAGPPVVERLVSDGRSVFLDLKLHDIPNTVAGAVRAASSLGVRLLTVHASGGEPMLRAAAEAASEGSPRVQLLAITVLTSLADADLGPVMGVGTSLEEAVGRLAGLARECGASGAVASVNECRAIKLACGARFLVATPGIRLGGQEADDQRRVATPSMAKAAGADFIVVGRSITRAADPAEALRRVRTELAGPVRVES